MLETALEPVRTLLDLSWETISREASSGIAMADEAFLHTALSGGKRIRPALFLLSAKVSGAGDQCAEHLASTAAAIELIHTASLMHDDVVDGATLRRGESSANHIWGDGVSVLTGDFLWSVASRLILRAGNQRLIESMIESVRRITLGEMLELELRWNCDTDEKKCLEVIEGKTASLFSAAARAGAIIAGAGESEEEALADYGRLVGVAYQLADDALDYTSSSRSLGKVPGADLASGTPTCPFVSALGRASSDEARILRDALVSKNGTGLDDVLPIIRRLGGIDRTMALAKECSRNAKEALSRLPASPEKASLVYLADFAAKRDS